MRNLLGVCLLVLGLCSYSFGRIVEIKQMKEILPEIEDQTLVAFDLDNTLVEAKQMLGGDAWFEYLLHQFTAENMAKGMDQKEATLAAIPKASAGWQPYQQVTEVNVVESGTPDLIRALQRQGRVTMGLTARPLELERASLRQLRTVGVDFFQGGKLPAVMKGFSDNRNVAWHHGVLFVGPGQDKGTILKRFLEKNNVAHKKIVFVDDKQRNVDAVDRAFDGTTTPCVCFRYGAADEKVRRFDPKIAEMQRQWYGRILSDEAAARLVENQVPGL